VLRHLLSRLLGALAWSAVFRATTTVWIGK
jgi:hypothetical protein